MAKTFTSKSPINNLRLTTQNGRLYNWLIAGKKIHCMHKAKIKLRIGILNSRISDLRNTFKIPIKGKYITAKDTYGEDTTVVEYFIPEEFRKQNKIAA